MLEKKNRLRKQKDFKEIFGKSKNFQSQGLILKFLPNGTDVSRFAFVVSLRIDKKATVRNRLRRQFGEIIKNELNRVRKGIDAVLIAKKPILKNSFQATREEIIFLMKKGGLYA